MLDIVPPYERGDRVEYSGSFVNMRGTGTFLAWDVCDDGYRWAVVKINGAIARVAPGGLKAVAA